MSDIGRRFGNLSMHLDPIEIISRENDTRYTLIVGHSTLLEDVDNKLPYIRVLNGDDFIIFGCWYPIQNNHTHAYTAYMALPKSVKEEIEKIVERFNKLKAFA